ncbi:MAG: penicillin-binding protein 1C, partial [Desulfobacterales bacterium]|nr:penicillin-binding protein 1C [Desulfobacterales bacterium]
NYSRTHYGPVTLRNALGNSLNIPAIRALQFIGQDYYYQKLHTLGFKSLNQHPDHYGLGLALGNGEVSLFELVQAYSVLARQGVFIPLAVVPEQLTARTPIRIFSFEIASLIGHILSDSNARRLEFGDGNILRIPVQTAIKTGTSSDYRDAWAVGYNYRYTVGVWMGNLDQTPTYGITGSLGPALVLRSVFYELNRMADTRPLAFSPKLIPKDVKIKTEKGVSHYTEWFIETTKTESPNIATAVEKPHVVRPVNGLMLAIDPRIPRQNQEFQFFIDDLQQHDEVAWVIDQKPMEKRCSSIYPWHVEQGEHAVYAIIFRDQQKLMETEKVIFTVR